VGNAPGERPGQAVVGLQLLRHSQSPQDVKNHPLVEAYNVPEHRAREGHAIANSGFAKAMIDTSDGLLADLGHICEKSGVGAEIFQNKLPLSETLLREAKRMKIDPYDMIMSDSDDYELIITCMAENIPHIRSAIASISDVLVSEIGRITETKEKIQLIYPDGSKRPVTPSGWDHFKKQEE
jgi:thiamine-monophosphate kinase